jgi:hypothetical protein
MDKKIIYDKVYAHYKCDTLITKHFKYALMDNVITDAEYEFYFIESSVLKFDTHTKHPLCLGDGIDTCDYNTIIDCEECKYNNTKYPGRKDPAAKINQIK